MQGSANSGDANLEQAIISMCQQGIEIEVVRSLAVAEEVLVFRKNVSFVFLLRKLISRTRLSCTASIVRSSLCSLVSEVT